MCHVLSLEHWNASLGDQATNELRKLFAQQVDGWPQPTRLPPPVSSFMNLLDG